MRTIASAPVGHLVAADSPAHLWPEARNPANQWLANINGEAKAHMQVTAAGECARAYVWAGLTPGITWRDVQAEAARATRAGRPDVAAAARRGWYAHQAIAAEPECACWVTDPSTWFTYYGAVEPGSQWEWNPECPVHR